MVCFGRDIHYKAIHHFRFSCTKTVRKILIKEVKDTSSENTFIGTATDMWIMD